MKMSITKLSGTCAAKTVRNGAFGYRVKTGSLANCLAPSAPSPKWIALAALRKSGLNVAANSALVTDACERRSRAFFSAAQRER